MKAAKSMDRERLLLLCLPTLSVRTTITCNKGNNAQTIVDFNFSFFVQVRSRVCCSVWVCYSFLLLQAADLAVVEGVLEVGAAGVAAGERDSGGSMGAAGERRRADL
jgi:hypothetical protein